MNERQMDLMKTEAERRFEQQMEEIQRRWLGRRAEYGNQGENLQGEVGGQLVQRGAEINDTIQEPGERQPGGEEIGAGAGDQGSLVGSAGSI